MIETTCQYVLRALEGPCETCGWHVTSSERHYSAPPATPTSDLFLGYVGTRTMSTRLRVRAGSVLMVQQNLGTVAVAARSP